MLRWLHLAVALYLCTSCATRNGDFDTAIRPSKEKGKLAQAVRSADEIRVSLGDFCQPEAEKCERVLRGATASALVNVIELRKKQSTASLACQADTYIDFYKDGKKLASISYLSYLGIMRYRHWSGELLLAPQSHQAVNRWLQQHKILARIGCGAKRPPRTSPRSASLQLR